MSYYKMQQGNQVNEALEELPTAKIMNLMAYTKTEEGRGIDPAELEHFRTVRVDAVAGSKFVYCPTKLYKVVQHKDAFKPIVEGLTTSGVHDFQFIMTANWNRANMQIYVGGEGNDGVTVGFNCANSYDGSKALSYGVKMQQFSKSLELVGYRQICSNGMKIRVPLGQAEIIKQEVVERVHELFAESTRIKHMGNMDKKIEAVKYVVEAVSLLQEPVNRIIEKAKNTVIDREKLKAIVLAHVGKRYANRVERQFKQEPNSSAWDLYNAITYVASHQDGMKLVSRENLIDKAADYLETQTLISDTLIAAN